MLEVNLKGTDYLRLSIHKSKGSKYDLLRGEPINDSNCRKWSNDDL